MSLASGWVAGLLASAAAAVGIGLGCVLQLRHEIACGDGYVDRLAGEECDPGDPDSFEGACMARNFPEGIGDCDPVECTIIADLQQCQRCGDGILQPSNVVSDEIESATSGGDTDVALEQCDIGEFGAMACPMGGEPRCDDTCQLDRSMCLPYCGDGDLSPTEECGEPPGGFVLPKACAPDGNGNGGIVSPYGALRRYGSGLASCNQCLWSRGQCSYCGNGMRDPDIWLDNTGLPSPAEPCDGDEFDETLFETLATNCDEERGARPNVRCEPDCLGFELDDDGRDCCVRSNAFCPTAEEDLKCCYEYDHPEDPEPCEDDGTVQPRKCK